MRIIAAMALVALAAILRPETADGRARATLLSATSVSQDFEVDLRLARARESMQSGSLAAAENEVRAVLERKPDSWEAHFLLGSILFSLGRAPESLAEFTNGSNYHDPRPQDLKIVALDYVLLGDLKAADRWLTKSLEGNPNDPEAWYHLGRTRYNETRYEDAIDAFHRCLLVDKKNVRAKANLGLSLAALGRSEEARAAYREAIAWQETNDTKIAEPFIDLGDLLIDQAELAEAVISLRRAEEIAPADPRVPELLGKAYWRQGELQAAEVQLQNAIRLRPENAANHYLLGQVYRRQGKQAEAKREFDRLAELNDAHARAKTPNQ